MKDKSTSNLLYVSITSAVSLFAVILSGMVSYIFSKTNELETRKYELNRIAFSRVLEKVSDYSNYSTVNWDVVDDLYYRPYNCDWGKREDKLISEFTDKMKKQLGKEVDYTPSLCDIWHKLQNAKEDFRKKTIEVRVIGSGQILESIKQVEEGFDDVFIEIAQDYYGRAFVDYYNKTMSSRFQALELSFRNEINLKK